MTPQDAIATEVIEIDVPKAKPEEAPAEAPAANGLFAQHPKAKPVLIVLALLAVLGSAAFWFYSQGRESTDDAQIEGDIVPVAARVPGTVVKVAVDDNQAVKAGDLLLQLDPRDYQVALDRATAEWADAQASAQAARDSVPVSTASTHGRLLEAQADLSAAQQEVTAAQARLQETEANHQRIAADLKRYQQLIQRDEISQQMLDTTAANERAANAAAEAAKAAVAVAKSHVAQAQARLQAASTVREQIAVTHSQAGAADATAQTKQAALAQARLDLGYTEIRAAVDGVVTKKTVQLGQTVAAGQPMMALVPLDDVWVVANFKESQLKDMHVGQKVKVHVDAYDREFEGHVESIGGATAARTSLLPPENATGNYVKVVQRIPVKIVFEKGQNPDHVLRPGMSVVPTVITR